MKAGTTNNSPTAPSAAQQSITAGSTNVTPQPGGANNQGPAPPNTTIGHYIIGK